MGILIAYLLGIWTTTITKDQPRGRGQQSDVANTHQLFPNNPISVVCIPPPLSETEKAKKKKNELRETIKFWVEVVGVVLLFIYASFTILIWCANKKAADATTRAANSEVAANRAWIVPDFPPQHKRVIEDANLVWHNAGKTPAISVFSWKEYFSGEFPKRMNTCAEAENAVTKQPTDSRQYQAFIAQSERYEIGLDHAPAWVGQQPIFIHGCIWYTDISSNTEKSSEFFYVAFQNNLAVLNPSQGISLFFDRPFIYK
jgi:hypothetical protein